MSRLAKSRFNPTPGILDFWNEIRKPNPYWLPILVVSMAPFGLIFLWLSGERVFTEPERPTITYITTFDPTRTDEEIIASNIANQEIKDLREADAEARAERKREIYKALGEATGMDVDAIERDAQEQAAAEQATEQAAGAAPEQTAAGQADTSEPSGDVESFTP